MLLSFFQLYIAFTSMGIIAGGFTVWNSLKLLGVLILSTMSLAFVWRYIRTARRVSKAEELRGDALKGKALEITCGVVIAGIVANYLFGGYGGAVAKLLALVVLTKELWTLFLWPLFETLEVANDPDAKKMVRAGVAVLGFYQHVPGRMDQWPYKGVYGNSFEPNSIGTTHWSIPNPARPVLDSLFIQLRNRKDYYSTVQLGVYSKAGYFWRSENAPFPIHVVHALSDAIPKRVPALEACRAKIIARLQELAPNTDDGAPSDRYDSRPPEGQSGRFEQLIDAAKRSKRGVTSAWDKVLLPPALKSRIEHRLNRFQRTQHAGASGLLLYGPPGTGKTLLAKAIAEHFGMYFKAVTPADLKGPYIGWSERNTKELWDEMRSNSPSILFVDECEGVFAKRGSHDADVFDQGIVRAFISNWDGMQKGSKVFVIGATNNRSSLDEAILSRFSEAVEIPLPDEATRLQILKAELALRDCTKKIPASLGPKTIGMSGRDLAKLADAALMAVDNGASIGEALEMEAERLRKGRSDSVESSATWDTLVLSDAKKKEIQTIVGTLQNAAVMKKQGIAIPKSVLFYGPPGTGKTQIARTIANEAKLSFHLKTTAELKGNFLGQSGNNTRLAFTAARSSAPAILCLDEIDLLTPARQGGSSDSYTGEIVGQLLQEMDGARSDERLVCVVGITNNLNALDPAVLSRFGTKIEIGLPTKEERQEMLMILLRTKPVQGDVRALVERLANESEGKSGRDLKMLIEAAERKAVARALEQGKPEKVRLCLEDF